MVPGSTLRYGSNFCSATLRPRFSSSVPSAAAVRPLPSELTTPPVTKMNFISNLEIRNSRIPLAGFPEFQIQEFFHPLDIRWHVHAHAVVIHFHDRDADAV